MVFHLVTAVVSETLTSKDPARTVYQLGSNITLSKY